MKVGILIYICGMEGLIIKKKQESNIIIAIIIIEIMYIGIIMIIGGVVDVIDDIVGVIMIMMIMVNTGVEAAVGMIIILKNYRIRG